MDRYGACSYNGDARIAGDLGDDWEVGEVFDLENDNTVRNVQFGPNMDLFAGGDETLYWIRNEDDSVELVDAVSIGAGTGRALATKWDGSVFVGTTNSSTFYKFTPNGETDTLEQEWTYDVAGGGSTAAAVAPSGEIAIGNGNQDIEIITDEDTPSQIAVYDTRFSASSAGIREIVFNADNDLWTVQSEGKDPNFNKATFDPDAETITEQWAIEGAVNEPSYNDGGYPGMSVNTDDEAVLAGNDGYVYKYDVSSDDEPTLLWEYQLSSADGSFDALLHQAAIRPDNGDIYGCSYEGEIEKIEEDSNGDPQSVWVDDYYTTTPDPEVREVRVWGEHVGTWPSEWGVYT